jgi:hypothetical protein
MVKMTKLRTQNVTRGYRYESRITADVKDDDQTSMQEWPTRASSLATALKRSSRLGNAFAWEWQKCVTGRPNGCGLQTHPFGDEIIGGVARGLCHRRIPVRMSLEIEKVQ